MLITNLRYLSYQANRYGNGKNPGILCQFVSSLTGDGYHVFFNASLERQRSTKKHKKGSPLPKGHFTPKPNSGFIQMWRSIPLPLPKSLTSFYDCMGKLKPIVFMAETSKGNRLNASTLRPMYSPDESLITSRQLPDKILINLPDKDYLHTSTTPALQENLSTCQNNYVISKKVSENISKPIATLIDTNKVEEQTNEEWLDEYEEHWALECDELF